MLTDFANSLRGSPYFNIDTTYYNSAIHKSMPFSWPAKPTITISRGKNLSDSDLLSIVVARNPADINRVYFVVSYCAWQQPRIRQWP